MQLQVQKKKEWINIGKEAIPRNPKVSTEHKCTEMYFKFEKVVIDGIMGRELEYGLIEMWVIHRRHIDSKTLFILKPN